MLAMKTAWFITLEGIEGVGKTTNLAFVRDYLQSRDLSVTVTREPGGTPLAEQIRTLLLSTRDETVHADTELLLMFAARAQHIAQTIKPALAAGKTVLSDRFVDASFAYQGGGRGIPVTRIAELERWTLADFRPDLTLLLDLDPEIALARTRARGATDRFEQERTEFFVRARAEYLRRAHTEPQRFAVIDAAQPLPVVQAQIASHLARLLDGLS